MQFGGNAAAFPLLGENEFGRQLTKSLLMPNECLCPFIHTPFQRFGHGLQLGFDIFPVYGIG